MLLLLGVVLWGTSAVLAQNDRKIAEQKKVVADLERKIAEEERQLTKLRTGKKTTEETVRRLSRQIESRSQLLYETEKQSKALRGELNRTGNVADSLSKQLQRHREQYAEMVRDAYRNYRHHNYLTYIFSSRDFKDIARRIVDLREMAEARQRRMEAIASLNEKVQHQKSLLEKNTVRSIRYRKNSHDNAIIWNATHGMPARRCNSCRTARKPHYNANWRRKNNFKQPLRRCAS